MSSRKRTKSRSRSPAPIPIVRSSGRFDSLVDIRKGAIFFPYLHRRVEGRALGAVGPVADLELARTARQVSVTQCWPREVLIVSSFPMVDLSLSLSGVIRV